MGYNDNKNRPFIQVDNQELSNEIGLLSDLKTTDKSSLVNAVNENVSQLAEYPTVTRYANVADAFAKDSVRMYFPPGNYSFKNVPILQNTEIILADGAILTAPSDTIASDSFFTITGTSSGYIPMVTIRGGQFDGQGKMGHIISGQYASVVKVTEVKTTGFIDDVVSLNNCQFVQVKENEIDGGNIGIAVTNTIIATIADNIVSNTKKDSILVYSNSGRVNVRDNKCKNFITVYEAGRGGIQIYEATDVSVSDNFCWTDDGIVVNGRIGIRVRDCERIKVTGNNVKDLDHEGIEIIRLGDFPSINAKDIIVANNIIKNVKSNGINIAHSGSATTIGECQVFGNVINTIGYINSTNQGRGIVVSASMKTKIMANTITNADSNGIDCEGSDYADIISNNIENTGVNPSSTNKEGIFFTGNNVKCLNNTVIDTQATPTMSYAIRQYSGSAKVFGNITNRSNWLQGTLLPYEAPLFSITAVPQYLGQVAIVGGIAYMATGTTATTDWKQIS